MGWAEALVAISLTIMAVVLVAATLVMLISLRDFGRVMSRLDRVLSAMEEHLGPTLESSHRLLGETKDMVGKLDDEVDAVVKTSRRLRGKVENAAGAIEDRLLDLDALFDVAQTELEDTVLDVAAALRTGRRSASVLGRIKRRFLRRR